ncbi:Na+/H+ antiporter subunit D [Curtobacterium sp. S6]|uniref:Na+/H+ antiporter subunit D n=1 Tax=Curtobacterium sp. S6 TaxID=1479623 RepID=UPI0004AB7480|nr:Na+/H+ antiporter subunit D [Curtobacterium sp. S6]
MNVVELAPAAVVLPLLAAGLNFTLYKFPNAQRLLSIIAMIVILALEITLLISTWGTGPQAVTLGGWAAPFGIVMVVDQLSSLMLVVSTVVSFAVLIYATGQGLADGDGDAPISVFYPTFLVLLAGVSNAFLAGDLFNLYVGFEILLTASYVLLTMSGTAPRIRAGVTYTVVSVISSMLFLISIGMIYAALGTVNMADIAAKAPDLPVGTQLQLHLMLLVAFGIKAAVFPLSLWLPDSYPTAPAPVTAVFAGLLTKVGVYAIIRTETLLFPGGTVDNLLAFVAAATLIVGILGALTQSDIKRTLSFILISHIGYMIWGISLSTPEGLMAVVFYVAHHIVIQTSLFMVVGLIERRGGSANTDRLAGLAKIAPILGILYFIPAMNLGGIPPFSGFLGKVGLIDASVRAGTWQGYALAGVGVFVSLLTLLTLARIWNRVFWRKPEDAEFPDPILLAKDQDGNYGVRTSGELSVESRRYKGRDVTLLPRPMIGSTIGLVAVGVAITLLAGPLFDLSDQAANNLSNPQTYIEAVLGHDRAAAAEGGH